MSLACVHLLPTYHIPKAGYRMDRAIQKLKAGKIKKLEAMGLVSEEFKCCDDDGDQYDTAACKTRTELDLVQCYQQKLISLFEAMHTCQGLSSVDFMVILFGLHFPCSI